MTPQAENPSPSFDLQLFINKYPLFCLLNNQDKQHLAELTQIQQVESGVDIVQQGNIVDAVYFILSGTATVTRKINKINQTDVISIATLGPGDAIGLSKEGFFSHLGFRTASVTANTSMMLGVIDIYKFNKFLSKPSIPYPALKNSSEKILLMNFLQSTHLFNQLSDSQFERLTKTIKKITLTKDQELFKQNDLADNCYFIISGEISLWTKDLDQQEHLLKSLQPGNIVGESAFIQGGKRNAGARATKETELFILDNTYIEIFQNDPAFINALNYRQILQLRPQQTLHISAIEIDTANKSIPLSQNEYKIWQMLDGKTTLEFILQQPDFQQLSLYDLYHCITRMEKAGFIKISTPIVRKPEQTLLKKISRYFHNLFTKRK